MTLALSAFDADEAAQLFQTCFAQRSFDRWNEYASNNVGGDTRTYVQLSQADLEEAQRLGASTVYVYAAV